jgi:uncharacterized protein YdhG (YjbR/CyaY superfamily)
VGEQTLSYQKYLDGLPPERRSEIERVWAVVRESMPEGYTEEIGPKFISFKAGEEWYVALANQKNYISLHLIPIYVFPELKEKLDSAGKKLNCGKGCVNFKKAEQLPLEVIGEIIGAHDAEGFQAHMRGFRSARSTKKKKSKR